MSEPTFYIVLTIIGVFGVLALFLMSAVIFEIADLLRWQCDHFFDDVGGPEDPDPGEDVPVGEPIVMPSKEIS